MTKQLSKIVGLVFILNNLSFMPGLGPVLYAIVTLSLVILTANSGRVYVSGTMMWLYAACLLSILANNVPAFFNPYQRFALFFVMTLLLSPALKSDSLSSFRYNLFYAILYFLKYVVLISFVLGLMHMGYNRLYFQGLARHSMLLGPFAALCTLYCVCKFLGGGLEKKAKMFYSVLMLASLYCLLQAASRTAFIACAISTVVLLTVYYRNNLGRYFKVVFTLGIVLALSFPVWNRFMDKLVEKNQGDVTSLSVDSREALWKTRVKEFNCSPIIGIGFSTVDIDNKEGSTYSSDGKVETGSSWLCVLSMTGIMGFIPICLVFIMSFVKVWKMLDYVPLLSCFLIALQCFWILHMMTEGYVYAGGSSLFFCLWLLLGVMSGLPDDVELADSYQDIFFKRDAELCA